MVLLKWDMVNPGKHNSKAIYVAIKSDHVELVELLLSNHRNIPSAKHNRAISLAAEMGYINIVRLLIADKRVDLTVNTGVIWVASVCDHAIIMTLWIEHGCVMPRCALAIVVYCKKRGCFYEVEYIVSLLYHSV